MPEVTTALNKLQLGVETTPGTSVAANKLLRTYNATPAIQTSLTMVPAVGGKYALASHLAREWTTINLEGPLTYTEVVYLLSSVLTGVTPTQISPPTGTAYRWTFAPAQSSADSPKTYTVEYGSDDRAWKCTYGLVTEFSLSIGQDTLDVRASMLGRSIQDGITLTASPTNIEVVPVTRPGVSLWLDTTAAGLGTTKLLRGFTAEFQVRSRYNPVWVLDSAQASFAAHVEARPEVTLRLLVEADAQGMGLLTAMRQGDKRFIRLKATGPNIETGNDYTFQLDLCGLVSAVGSFADQDGVYAIDWTFTATYDATWGKAFEVQVVNKLSAL